jgi:alginate O-acetyltransferase complex protein AlgI
MAITSLAFAGFTLLALVIYYLLPRRAQNYWLLLLSYLFLVTWAWEFAAVLLAMTLANFVLAQRIQVATRNRRALLFFAVGIDIAALVFFKGAGFFLPQMLNLFARLGLSGQAGGLQILLPVGLSYYTFQAISYLLDVYQGQMCAALDVADFALYMAYFPKIVAGPIERARSFLPKLAQARVVDNDVLARSFTLIVVGLVRKIVIADPLAAMIPETAFYVPLQFASPELVFFLLAYAFSLYNDFAGYTSIVRGVSGLFGIELSPNFQYPYFARNLSEFWNRWHISLSSWCRDYIYLPLSRAFLRRNPSRRNVLNLIVPPMVTMSIIGLWHANWEHKTVILWGVLWGIYLVIERVVSLWKPTVSPDKQPAWRQVIAAVCIFVLVALAWVPFHEGSQISTTLAFYRGLVSWDRWVMPDLRIAIVILPALWLDWVQYRNKDELVFLRWHQLAQSALLALAMLVILLTLQADTGAPFVYQGF